MNSGITTNNLKDFKVYLDSDKSNIKEYANDVKYTYITELNIYKNNEDGSYSKGLNNIFDLYEVIGMDVGDASSMAMMSSGVFSELVGDSDYIKETYNLVYGDYPKAATDLVLIVDKNKQVTDYMLYSLGVCDTNELKEYFKEAEKALATGTENTYKINTPESFSYEELCALDLGVLTNADYFDYDEKTGKITECDEIALDKKIKELEQGN